MAAIAPNDTETVRVYSMDIKESAEFGLNEEEAPQRSWVRYIFGVCREILKRGGVVKGFDAVFAGNVPLGAGLSSSAALESCFAYALNDLFNDNTIAKFELALIGQSTEHKCSCFEKCVHVVIKSIHFLKKNIAVSRFMVGSDEKVGMIIFKSR